MHSSAADRDVPHDLLEIIYELDISASSIDRKRCLLSDSRLLCNAESA